MIKKKAYIVEDEKHNLEYLISLINEHYGQKIEILGHTDSILEGSEFLKNTPVDVIFLDIELADGQVFDLLRLIDYKKYKLIFITGYSQYAINAIRFSALDYLLKPIVTKEFTDAVDKLLDTDNHNIEIIEEFVKQNDFKFSEYLVLNKSNSIDRYKFETIMYMNADGAYTEIYMENSKTTASKSIKDFEDILPENQFFRCHKSHIVNRHFIKKVMKGRALELTLFNGTVLPVSVRKKEEFINWYKS